jgi:hypothetical protein
MKNICLHIMKKGSQVIFLNTCYKIFSDRYKISDLTEEHGTRFYGYGHTIAILITLNWFGHRLKGITTVTLVKMGL